MAAFEDDLRVKAGAIAGGKDVFAKAVAVAEQEEGFGAEISESQQAAVRQGVFLRKSGEQGLAEDGEGLEFVTADGKS